jgi:hypothetical protein
LFIDCGVKLLTTLLFFLLLAIMGFCMKLVVRLLPSRSARTRWAFIISPFVTPDMLDRWIPASQWRNVCSRCAASVFALMILYWIYWTSVDRFEIHGNLLSYLAVPILLMMAAPLVVLVSLIWLPTGRIRESHETSQARSGISPHLPLIGASHRSTFSQHCSPLSPLSPHFACFTKCGVSLSSAP